MPDSTLDHIVITATSLKSGVEWVRDALGATPEFGGQHPRIGTHNCLLSLGGKAYLEVIAPDPNAPTPELARLFELDNLAKSSKPRVAAWVARSSDIEAAVSASTEPMGRIQQMSRGKLNWLITLTDDGSLGLGGAAPVLIQWPQATHPSTNMRDSGCRLSRLELHHPDTKRVESLLQSIGFSSEAEVTLIQDSKEPFLAVVIQTALGEVTLSKP